MDASELKLGSRPLKAWKRIVIALAVAAAILAAVFLAGRYGWKLLGFRACQGAGIEAVEVSEDKVHISGFYPGSFPEGFCGYYSEERDGTLYVGFRFSAVFGFFETGDFDVTVPVKGEISEVILKTSRNESALWEREMGFLPQSERYGVYVKLERDDIFSVSMSYDGSSSGGLRADGGAWESGKYVFMDNDIMMAAKDAEAPVPFTITAKGKDETVLATRELHFDAGKEKMFLTVTVDGQIVEDKAGI